MRKARFAIIGSGWRTSFYVRVAKALKDHFEICAMLTRTKEKAELIKEQYGINTTTSPEQIEDMHPDFVVVAVDKAHIAEISLAWLKKGIPVLCETPIGLDVSSLRDIYEMHKQGYRIAVAEQYHLYPENIARIRVIDMDLIGEANYLYISLAHEYHGISLMRRFLKCPVNDEFSIEARQFVFPGKETMSRYERFTDGRIGDKTRTLALFTFSDNKTALYDFDSDQYRSLIRGSHYKLQGINGEMADDTITYLDDKNECVTKKLEYSRKIVKTDSDNPNFREYEEIERIILGSQIVYEPEFGMRNLSQDETAIAAMLRRMADYVDGGKQPYPLAEGLQDAYMAILLRKAIESGEKIKAEKMPWME